MSTYDKPGTLWGTIDSVVNGWQTIKAFTNKVTSDTVMKKMKRCNMMEWVGDQEETILIVREDLTKDVVSGQ